MGYVTQVDPGFTSRNNFDTIDAALSFLSLVNLSCFIGYNNPSAIIKNRKMKVAMTQHNLHVFICFFTLSCVVDFDDVCVFTIKKLQVYVIVIHGNPRMIWNWHLVLTRWNWLYLCVNSILYSKEFCVYILIEPHQLLTVMSLNLIKRKTIQ